jgi:5,10-methylenetetrahydromethanopterin reductase
VLAEDLGFAGAWIADSQSIFRDAFAVLAVCAVRTERIKLATGVSNPITRHAAVLAGSFATLDELSGHRAILGIGVGESSTETIGAKPARIARMREVAEAARDLMRGEKVVLDATELVMPWSKREVPVYVAASGPRSLRAAGAYADGVLFQVGASPAMVRYAIDHVREGAEAAGRDTGAVKLLARLACSVAQDREWARDQVGGYATVAAGTVFTSVPAELIPPDLAEDIRRMKDAYDYLEHGSQQAKHRALVTDRIIDAVSISGTPEEAIPRFRELVDLGVDGFVTPIATDDPAVSMRSLAEGVIPSVQG